MASPDVYDRQAEINAFEATKTGVKGLVDAGLTTTLPRIFRIPSDEPTFTLPTAPAGSIQVPVIDLAAAGAKGDDLATVIDAVRRAAGEWGFFQVVGHSIPQDVMDEALRAGRMFHELTPAEEKAKLHARDGRKVLFVSNYRLFTSRFAEWQDTFTCRMAPQPPEPEEIPAICRDAVIKFSQHMSKMGDTLLELLSRSLGLQPDRLKELGCNKGQSLLFQYYPPCPDPESALGAGNHSDTNFLTVLLQDNVGGLQVRHGDQWVDVQPIPGALVVNVGDLLQIMSNGKFVSVEHRVRVNKDFPRGSIGYFANFNKPFPPDLYGPIAELLSDDNPPLYRQFTLQEYADYIAKNGHLRGKGFVDSFRL